MLQRKGRSLTPLFMALILLLVISACGSGTNTQANPTDNIPSSTPVPTEIVAIVSESEPTQEPTTHPEEPTAAVTEEAISTDLPQGNQPLVTAGASNVNIRSGPGTNYEVVGSLPAGASLEIIGRNADSSWWQVVVPNGFGWIAASVTTANGVNANIPIAEAAPPSVQEQPPQEQAVVPTSEPEQVQGLQEGQVINIVDGDTIDVFINGTEYRVRYILIDTPESTTSVEPFGPEATEANRRLVEDKMVQLEKDVSETDRYGRLLRYVYVDGLMVNEELLRQGMATVATFPPDVKYVDRFLDVQRQAQAAGVGMWASQPAVEAPTPLPAEPAQPSNTSGYTGPYDPNGPDRDCGDFSTWEEAQAFYEAAGGPASDPHRLDRERDGIACESLR